ncbi:selenium cofactor biosynthesis protein YqeC [uncultured Vagococcus sp.]|uniref:selenium cofactor biosynthesis protein YqeC n=1 Tax=uncultured Vagococcus sp. TaxID=189676 RepID=UPI0028D856B0|nr:selenium cofactor biosynthesis protein YqeC [uncultured Vagococcus sp.]
MENLEPLFGIKEKECVSIIGSGGKTSLMWYLGEAFRCQRVLVGTTTKISLPSNQLYDRLFLDDYPSGKEGLGISLIGKISSFGKLIAPPLEVLSQNVSYYDKVLLEADGSKQRPLKGWADFEPVVLPETSLTIGVIPIKVIGKVISGKTVHRLAEFTDLTGLVDGDNIDELTLAALVNHKRGIWNKARGRRCLLINQVENPAELEQAKAVVQGLSPEILATIERVIACSLKERLGEIIWQRV